MPETFTAELFAGILCHAFKSYLSATKSRFLHQEMQSMCSSTCYGCNFNLFLYTLHSSPQNLKRKLVIHEMLPNIHTTQPYPC